MARHTQTIRTARIAQYTRKAVASFLIFLLLVSPFLTLLAPSVNAASNTWDFTNSADYTFDSSKVEISSGQAQLKSTSNWFNSSWNYRRTIDINNSGNSSTLSDYSIQITLNNSNFDFSKVLSDGSDIRVTDSDGMTLIPYYIESIDSGAQTASVWVKVPTIPASSTTSIYVYYGNSSPVAFDIPPLGPFEKYSTNPIIAETETLPENIVYDDTTQLYWLVFEDRLNAATGLAFSSDLVTWTEYASNPVATGTNPHLLHHNDTWYLFTGGTSIGVKTASSVTGPYSSYSGNPILSKDAGGWEDIRILEPYVFQGSDGAFVMFYMGQGSSGEQVGYATAPAPEGPWTKHIANPVVALGSSESYDAGTVADPFVYKFGGTYYVYYSAGRTSVKPWQIAAAKSTDLVNFTSLNVVLGYGNDGTWEEGNAHRGALSKFGDYYYLTYSGWKNGPGYRAGLARQYAKSMSSGYPPEQVFDLYDSFSESSLSSHLRADGGSGGSNSIADGVLTLNSGSGTEHKLTSVQEFGSSSGYLLEAHAQHPDADGTLDHLGGLGFGRDNSTLTPIALWADGKFGKGLSFDGSGTNQYVDFGSGSSLNLTDRITIEGWLYWNGDASHTHQMVVVKNNAFEIAIRESNNNLWWGLKTTNYWTANATSYTVPQGQWMHIALTYDKDVGGKVFVNGTSVATIAADGPIATSTDHLTIGNRITQSYYLNGLVDELRISNDIRHTENFTPPVAAFEADANTVALLHLDEGLGTTTMDETTNNNDGSLVQTTSNGSGIRMYSGLSDYWIKSAYDNVAVTNNDMSQSVDTDWHTYRVWWQSGSSAQFQIDNNPWESLASHIPIGTYSVWMTAKSSAGNTTALNVDWLRVRRYTEPEPPASVSSEIALHDASNPTINPISSGSQTFASLSVFSETATKNGGEIKYQISNDAGTTWYWFNSGWTTTSSGYSEANTASDINTSISSFPLGSGEFLFKAYLHSNGTQLVQLDSVNLTYSADDSGPPLTLTALSPDPNSNNTPSIAGSATDAVGTVSNVQFQIDGSGAAWSSCTADDGAFDEVSEAFTCTVTTSLSDSTHTMYVRASDDLGNTNTASDTFVIDTKGPARPGQTVRVRDPENGQEYEKVFTPQSVADLSSVGDNDLPTFCFTKAYDSRGGEGIRGYTVRVDGKEYISDIAHTPPSRDDHNARWEGDTVVTKDYDKYTLRYSNFTRPRETQGVCVWGRVDELRLASGFHTWSVKAHDTAGNTAETETRRFLVKTSIGSYSPDPSTWFPLVVLQIGNLSNIADLTTLQSRIFNDETTPYAISTQNPTFYGIANTGTKVNITLEKEEKDTTTGEMKRTIVATGEITANEESRWGINFTPDVVSLTSSANYYATVIGTLENKIALIKEIPINVSTTTFSVLGAEDERRAEDLSISKKSQAPGSKKVSGHKTIPSPTSVPVIQSEDTPWGGIQNWFQSLF